jgi:hypothetical protein
MLFSRPVFCRLVPFPIDALLTLMLYVVRDHLRTPGAEAQFVGLVEATGSTVKTSWKTWFSGWYAVNSIQSWLIPPLILISNVVSDHLTTIPKSRQRPCISSYIPGKMHLPRYPIRGGSVGIMYAKTLRRGPTTTRTAAWLQYHGALRLDSFPNHIKTFATKYQLLI